MSIDMSIHINTGEYPYVMLTINRKRWWLGYYCFSIDFSLLPRTWGKWNLWGVERQCLACDRFGEQLDMHGECFDCAGNRYYREMAEDMFYGRTMTLDCGWCGCEYQESMYEVKKWYRRGDKYNHLNWLCPTCKEASEDEAYEDDGDGYWDYDYDECGDVERTPLDGGIRLCSCHLCRSIYKVSDEEWAYVSMIEFDPCTYAERFTCPTCRKNTKLLTDKAAAAASDAWEESVNQLPPVYEGTFYLCPTCAHLRPVTNEEWNPIIPGPTAAITPAPQYVI